MKKAQRGRPFSGLNVKKLVSVLLTIVGVFLVLGSGFAVYTMAQNVPTVRLPDLRQVVVVAKAIDERSPIMDASVRIAEVPAETVPEGALTSLPEAAGKVAAVPLVPGEILVRNRLMDPGTEQTMSAQLQPNEVAVTFPSTGVAGVGGLVAGDRIDVVATYKSSDSKQGGTPTTQPPATLVVLQNIRVLNVGKWKGVTASRTAGGEGGNMVVLATTYDEALILKALKDADNLVVDLVLRPIGMTAPAPAGTVTAADALQARPPKTSK